MGTLRDTRRFAARRAHWLSASYVIITFVLHWFRHIVNQIMYTPVMLYKHLKIRYYISITIIKIFYLISYAFESDAITLRAESQWAVRSTVHWTTSQHLNMITLFQGDWGDPFVHNGVLFGHFVAGDEKGFCSSAAEPVLLADVHSVVSWIEQVIGAWKLEHIVLNLIKKSNRYCCFINNVLFPI